MAYNLCRFLAICESSARFSLCWFENLAIGQSSPVRPDQLSPAISSHKRLIPAVGMTLLSSHAYTIVVHAASQLLLRFSLPDFLKVAFRVDGLSVFLHIEIFR